MYSTPKSQKAITVDVSKEPGIRLEGPRAGSLKTSLVGASRFVRHYGVYIRNISDPISPIWL